MCSWKKSEMLKVKSWNFNITYVCIVKWAVTYKFVGPWKIWKPAKCPAVPKKRFSEIQHFDIWSERYQICLLVTPKRKALFLEMWVTTKMLTLASANFFFLISLIEFLNKVYTLRTPKNFLKKLFPWENK